MIGKIKQTKVSIQYDPKKYAKLFHFEGLLYKMLEKQNHLTICATDEQRVMQKVQRWETIKVMSLSCD